MWACHRVQGGATQARSTNPCGMARALSRNFEVLETSETDEIETRCITTSSTLHRTAALRPQTPGTMAPKRLGGSRRSYNPITGVYNAFVVSENAPIVRSVAAFSVRSHPILLSHAAPSSTDTQTGRCHISCQRLGRGHSLVSILECLHRRDWRGADTDQPRVVDRPHSTAQSQTMSKEADPLRVVYDETDTVFGHQKTLVRYGGTDGRSDAWIPSGLMGGVWRVNLNANNT